MFLPSSQNYVLTGRVGADKNDEWLSYFDVVITGSGKPNFFTQKQSLFAVDVKTGKFSLEGLLWVVGSKQGWKLLD